MALGAHWFDVLALGAHWFDVLALVLGYAGILLRRDPAGDRAGRQRDTGPAGSETRSPDRIARGMTGRPDQARAYLLNQSMVRCQARSDAALL